MPQGSTEAWIITAVLVGAVVVWTLVEVILAWRERAIADRIRRDTWGDGHP